MNDWYIHVHCVLTTSVKITSNRRPSSLFPSLIYQHWYRGNFHVTYDRKLLLHSAKFIATENFEPLAATKHNSQLPQWESTETCRIIRRSVSLSLSVKNVNLSASQKTKINFLPLPEPILSLTAAFPDPIRHCRGGRCAAEARAAQPSAARQSLVAFESGDRGPRPCHSPERAHFPVGPFRRLFVTLWRAVSSKVASLAEGLDPRSRQPWRSLSLEGTTPFNAYLNTIPSGHLLVTWAFTRSLFPNDCDPG